MTVKRLKNKIGTASKPFIDFLLGKTMSKKLTIMILTYIALMKGLVTGDNWVWIACAYITVEGGINYFQYLKDKAQNFGNNNLNVEEKVSAGDEDNI